MAESKQQFDTAPDFGSIRDDLAEHPKATRFLAETAVATPTLVGASLFGPVALIPYGLYRAYRGFSRLDQLNQSYVDPRVSTNVHPVPTGYVVDTGNDSYPIEDFGKQKKKMVRRALLPQAVAAVSMATVSIIGVGNIIGAAFDRGGEPASATDSTEAPAEQSEVVAFSCPLEQPLYPVSRSDFENLSLENKMSTVAIQQLFAGTKIDGKRLYDPKKIDGWYGGDTAVAQQSLENIIASSDTGQQALAEDPLAITPNGFFDTKTECAFAVGILSQETQLDLSNLSNNPELTDPFLR